MTENGFQVKTIGEKQKGHAKIELDALGNTKMS